MPHKGIGQKIVLFFVMIALGVGLIFGINYLAKDSEDPVQDPSEQVTQEEKIEEEISPDDERNEKKLAESEAESEKEALELEEAKTNEDESELSDEPSTNNNEENKSSSKESQQSSLEKQTEREQKNKPKEKKPSPPKQEEQLPNEKPPHSEKPKEEAQPPKEESVEKPSVTPTKKTVSLTIVGSQEMGTILGKTEVEIQSSDTVLDVLKKALRERNIQLSVRGGKSTAYIEGIHNLYEFDEGPGSGWMYSVNGAFPNRGAGVWSVKEGDQIQWLYTLDLGKDLGAGQ